jgi:hypothetical protein
MKDNFQTEFRWNQIKDFHSFVKSEMEDLPNDSIRLEKNNKAVEEQTS